jgi:hypothetical protein
MRLIISEFNFRANHSKMEEHNLQCVMRNPVYVDERGEEYLRIFH